MARGNPEDRNEWTIVLSWVAGILGVIALLLVITSATLSERHLDGALAQLVPPCPAAAAGDPCPACGLSHAFVSSARGRFPEARTRHPHGPTLFGGTAMLGVIGPTQLLWRLRRRWV